MSGVNFTLDSAKRIAAVVRKVEQTPRNQNAGRSPSGDVPTSFYAMITGASDIAGVFHDWVAVEPSATMAANVDPLILATSMWQFQQPYVAGFGNAREANDNRQIPAGAVVLLTFVGYSVAESTGVGVIRGTITTQGGSTAAVAGADNSIPIYVFSYPAQRDDSTLPIHDHRDNLTGGGFAFAVYHPGTALPQQRWSV